jgi:hypothetical protein
MIMATADEATDQSEPSASGAEARQAPRPADLDQLWRRWLAVVELSAQGSGAHPPMDAEEYGVLQRQLIETCRALTQVPGDRKPEIYQQLEDLVAPWLTVGVLKQADEEILIDLLLHCRQIDRQLGGRKQRFTLRGGARYLLPFLVIAGGAFVVVWTADSLLFPFLAWVNGWALWARWDITHAEGTVALFVGGGFVILLTSFLIWRVARN